MGKNLTARTTDTNGAAAPVDSPAAHTLQRVRVVSLEFDNLSFSEAVEKTIELADRSCPAYVVPCNVDLIMRARWDNAFREVCGKADLCLADGMPIIWASQFLGSPLKEKVSGSDMFEVLCRRASEEELRVFLVGGAPGVAEKTKNALQSKYPALNVVGTCSPLVSMDGSSSESRETVEMIRARRPHIVFVAFGCPKQEMWIARNCSAVGGGVCVAVGASFDFVAGMQKRAPRWMQRSGLEWLWRLAHDPRRLWKRYLIDDLPFLWWVAFEWVRIVRARRRS